MESEYLNQDIKSLLTEIQDLRAYLMAKIIQYDHDCLVKEHLDYLDLNEPE